MEQKLEQLFRRRVFVDQVRDLPQEQARQAVIDLYDQIVLQQELVRQTLKVDLEMGAPMPIGFDLGYSQPQETMHSIDTIVSLPVEEYDRLQKCLDATPHLDRNNAVCLALRAWLEKRGF